MFEVSMSFNTLGLIGIPVFIAASLYFAFTLGRLVERKNQQSGEIREIN